MENNKIVKSDLQIGDIVKVVDNGHQFTCYEEFYNKTKLIESKEFIKSKGNFNGEYGKIINYKYDKSNEEFIYVVNMDDNCALFGEEAIERVNKFRQGDEIVRVNTPSLLCELGKVVVVAENVIGIDDKCMIKLVGKIGTYKENTFDLFSENKKIKAGDIVKRIDSSWSGMEIGDIARVKSIDCCGNIRLEEYMGTHADYNFIKIESYKECESTVEDKKVIIKVLEDWDDEDIEEQVDFEGEMEEMQLISIKYVEELIKNNEKQLNNKIKQLKDENKTLKSENRVMKSEVKRYKPKEIVIDKSLSISAIEKMNCPIDFEVVRFGDEITVTIYNAELTEKLAIGKSKRNPKDEFDLETGIKIAACRALKKLFENRETDLIDYIDFGYYLKRC